ncbi:DUF2892 domain-containing protein [Haladaptatus sp. F3-133]|uniref:DUF2892 domain-containing protein n=1 Tax=Halorutilus salinus TaxID=2487751 RepID=A0A9Q4C5C1_9EURY|nr:DUF2892 domain-containing protein [Halorutilus salinus]MCX2819506.1 DUF2892 domain-containing protein [Halorutilus salinus]
MANLQKNVGSYDRGLRAVIGIIALAIGVAGIAGVGGVGEILGTYGGIVVGIAGGITAFTAVTGFCGAYKLLGVDTCDIGE